MDDELTDQLIPKLMDLFKMPEEQREFMFDFYIPEVNKTLIVVFVIFSVTLRLPAREDIRMFSTLQMKGESNINVWFPLMYSQNETMQPPKTEL